MKLLIPKIISAHLLLFIYLFQKPAKSLWRSFEQVRCIYIVQEYQRQRHKRRAIQKELATEGENLRDQLLR
jgi:hypothetical protein